MCVASGFAITMHTFGIFGVRKDSSSLEQTDSSVKGFWGLSLPLYRRERASWNFTYDIRRDRGPQCLASSDRITGCRSHLQILGHKIHTPHRHWTSNSRPGPGFLQYTYLASDPYSGCSLRMGNGSLIHRLFLHPSTVV